MRSHLLAFDDLMRQIKTAGAELANGALVSQLFLSLPDSYDPLVTALENIKEEDLTLDIVKQKSRNVLIERVNQWRNNQRRLKVTKRTSVATNSKTNATNAAKWAT